jgi:hypothetical protein
VVVVAPAPNHRAFPDTLYRLCWVPVHQPVRGRLLLGADVSCTRYTSPLELSVLVIPSRSEASGRLVGRSLSSLKSVYSVQYTTPSLQPAACLYQPLSRQTAAHCPNALVIALVSISSRHASFLHAAVNVSPSTTDAGTRVARPLLICHTLPIRPRRVCAVNT